MTVITESVQVVGDELEIWERVKDVARMPEYWHGQKEIKVGNRDGKVLAGILFAFGGRGEALVTVDDTARLLVLDYVSGPFRGKQSVSVSGGVISATWDISFKGFYRVISSFNEKHFRSGTLHALQRLCGQKV